ncbi:hypothetical protein NYF23_11135 [SAR92 clade bacterium H455]|uniref:MFS transporter n=1 Tax=SAR92 clade bacterium H455 TaxID=2974818 RepID=A0ABY5TL23_9GAMM|nr:hypothetical protein NYF23_11135 [SAR92 clade bacterium H455]
MLDVLRDEIIECESVDSENNKALSESQQWSYLISALFIGAFLDTF